MLSGKTIIWNLVNYVLLGGILPLPQTVLTAAVIKMWMGFCACMFLFTSSVKSGDLGRCPKLISDNGRL